MRSYFGNMRFRFCPSCLSELPEARADAAHWHLCTTPLGDGRGDTQLLSMRNELSIQLKESTSLIESRASTSTTRATSESSAVVLRHIFHLALLTASVRKPFMRVPRFIMLDGIDDGGMEEERSHRLQQIIVDECTAYEFESQVIFATSDINSALEESNLVVGRFFTPEARSLDVLAG